jgi:hypothetical protein
MSLFVWREIMNASDFKRSIRQLQDETPANAPTKDFIHYFEEKNMVLIYKGLSIRLVSNGTSDYTITIKEIGKRGDTGTFKTDFVKLHHVQEAISNLKSSEDKTFDKLCYLIINSKLAVRTKLYFQED